MVTAWKALKRKLRLKDKESSIWISKSSTMLWKQIWKSQMTKCSTLLWALDFWSGMQKMQTKSTPWFALSAQRLLVKTSYMSRRQDSSNSCKHFANWLTISVTKALIPWPRATRTPKASLKGKTKSTLKWIRRKRIRRLRQPKDLEERSALMSTIYVAIKMTKMPARSKGRVASALAETAHETTPKSTLLSFKTSLSLSARRKRAWLASWTWN